MGRQHAIGIDVGGTKMAGAIVDMAQGSVSETVIRPTGAERGAEDVLADVASMSAGLRAAAEGHNLTLLGVGICVPELVDLGGNVTSAQTLDWRGSDIRTRLQYDGRVVIESDVRAGAIAEARFGVGAAHDSFVFVSVGTGVSSTFVLSGRPWSGAHGNAIVAATGTIASTCEHCGRTQQLVLEDVASGAAMATAYGHSISDGTVYTAKEVISRAEAGDETALRVVTAAADGLASIVGYLINVLDPHAVVLGGGLGSAPTLYWEVFADRVTHHIFGEQSRKTPIIRSMLGDTGPLLGAALAVAEA